MDFKKSCPACTQVKNHKSRGMTENLRHLEDCPNNKERRPTNPADQRFMAGGIPIGSNRTNQSIAPSQPINNSREVSELKDFSEIICEYCGDTQVAVYLPQHYECCPGLTEKCEICNETIQIALIKEHLNIAHNRQAGSRDSRGTRAVFRPPPGMINISNSDQHLQFVRPNLLNINQSTRQQAMDFMNFPFPLPSSLRTSSDRQQMNNQNPMQFNPLINIMDDSGMNRISNLLQLLQSLSLTQSDPLNQVQVEEFGLMKYDEEKSKNLDEELKKCHICLSEFSNGEEIRILTCTHRFHKECVDKWLSECSHLCPLCKADLRRN